jgi:hypothetical protein
MGTSQLGKVSQNKGAEIAGLNEPTFEPDRFFRAIFRRASEFAMKEGKEGSEKVRRKSCTFYGTEKRSVHGKLPRSWG